MARPSLASEFDHYGELDAQQVRWVAAQDTEAIEAARDEAVRQCERLYVAGRLADGVRACAQALQLTELTLGPESAEAALRLNDLSVLVWAHTSSVTESEPIHRAALAALARSLGPEHEKVGVALANLGNLLQHSGRPEEAEAALRRSVTILETVNPGMLGMALGNLGSLLNGLARYDEAVDVLERAIDALGEAVGPDDWRVGEMYGVLAETLFNVGDESGALVAQEHALDLVRTQLGTDHPMTAKYLIKLANHLARHQRHDVAGRLASEAVAITERAMGPSHPEVGHQLTRACWVAQWARRLEDAERLCGRALAIAQMTTGPEERTVAYGERNLALVLRDMGRFDEAEVLLRQSCAHAGEVFGEETPAFGLCLSELGSFLSSQGAFTEAEALLEQSARIATNHVTLDPRASVEPLFQLASVFLETGRFDEALELQRRVLDIVEEAYPADHPLQVLHRTTYAHFLTELGRFAETESVTREAIAIAERSSLERHPHLWRALGILGRVMASTGRPEEAEVLSRQALEQYLAGPERNSLLAMLQNNLAIALHKLGRTDEAERYFRAALAELSNFGDAPNATTPLYNLGQVLQNQGRYDEAEELLRAALEREEAQRGPDHHLVGARLASLGVLLVDRGRESEAEASFRRAIDIGERILAEHRDIALRLSHLSVARVRRLLAMLLIRRGQFEPAFENLRLALDEEERDLAANLLRGTPDQRAARLRQFESGTWDVVSLDLDDLVEGRTPSELALETLLRRKGRLVDLEQATLRTVRDGEDAEGLALVDELGRAMAELGQLVNSSPHDEGANARQERILAEINDLRRRLAERAASYDVADVPVTVGAVAATLPPGSALLEIGLYAPHDFSTGTWEARRYVAYRLARGGEIDRIDLGLADEIDSEVAALRQAIQQRLPLGDVVRPLARRFQSLTDGVGHLYVASDGSLNLVPFDLLSPAGVTVSYLTSGRDRLRATNPVSVQSGRPLVVANVDFGTGERWTNLPGTAAEGRVVRRSLRRARLVDAQQASETSVKAADRPRVLHVASHGFFDPHSTTAEQPPPPLERLVASRSQWLSGRPTALVELDDQRRATSAMLRSGVVLAGANEAPRGTDDGLLTAAELAHLDLRATDLVVLSACDTGIGEIRPGDGVHGLRRGLVLAGSRAQVLSLWKVGDEATAALMKAFYARLARGAPVGAALRHAQSRLKTSRRWAHPYYWAGFTVSGDDAVTLER